MNNKINKQAVRLEVKVKMCLLALGDTTSARVEALPLSRDGQRNKFF